MPARLRQALADALVLDHPDAPWQPPEQLPPENDIRLGITLLERQVGGCDRAHAAYCVAKMMAAFNERMTKAESDLRTSVWFEACGDVPNDLWSAGTIELIRAWKRDEHFGRVPEPSDMRAVVEDRLRRRSTDLQRCRVMLARMNTQKAPVPKQQAPHREQPIPRLKRILAEQRDDMTVSDSDRLFNCANTERALAFQERRLMEPWAQQFFDDRVAAAGGPPRDSVGRQASIAAQRSSPSAKRLAELAAAKREGRPLPEYRGDVAENFDIPEVNHG